MAIPRTPLAERFWPRVEKTPNGCWTWTGALSRPGGYGQIARGGRHSNAATHRIAYELTYGPIPEGLWVLHSCDNPPCCNPAHLLLGTPADNTGDAASKGRLAWADGHVFRRHPERMGHGHKLNAEQVRQIRRLLGTMPQRAIAARFGVSQMAISWIAQGKSWKDVA